MEDRVPIEAREEPSASSDSLENRRKAIREEAGIAILLGGVIVLLHLILLCLGVLELRDISGSLIFIILLIIGFAVLLDGVWGLHRARNLTLEYLRPSEQETDFDESLKRTKPVNTWVILACLIAVGVCQPVFESKESIRNDGM
jgi:hypothetical protein